MRKRIYLSSPHMSGNEMKYIKEAFDTNWVAPLGANVTAFENEMCDYVGRKYAVALSSGTAAIHLGLKALGVGSGDYVFCSSFTFAGSCNPITYLDAKPVFIDSDYETYNMCPEALKKAFKKIPKPKAVIVVNLYGNQANLVALQKICREHKVPILEDAAESLGTTYNGKQSGSFGEISILSFNGNKIITTSGGGMLLTDNKDWRDKVLFWATQSREDFPWYQHEEIGYNYRLSNICAGIGRGQLEVLDERVKRKRQVYELYKKEFAKNNKISMCNATVGSNPNWWLTLITLDKDCKATFMDIITALAEYNIEARPAWKPMHMQPVFKECEYFCKDTKRDVSGDLFGRSVCLPSDSKMSDEDVIFVASIVNNIVS
ncbi:MAG: DegT/DnrJ/EryC1/StrS family aminotransferase [Firmicutes bacterium]|nr:DegT/DnrJ/EryC1/StrS family aminotransferase [Bacillota bacterium]